MKKQYKTVDVRTKAGHRRSARLLNNGWKVIGGSVYGSVLMEK